MLKAFRDNLKHLRWVLWVVIAAFVLFFIPQLGRQQTSQAAATVGDQTVSYGEFERSYRQAEEFYRRLYGGQFSSELARQIGLRRQVLDNLVADKILLEEARRIGLRVTDPEVRREILRLPVFKDADGSFIGDQTYGEILRSNGYRKSEFEESIRTQLLTEKVRGVLSENFFVSDREVADAYREQVERAKIRFLELPGKRFSSQVQLTDEHVESYFESHRNDYRVAEQRLVDYLLLDATLLRETLEAGDEEIHAYYEEHSDEFRIEEQVHARHILLKADANRSDDEARRQLEAIRRQIDEGADFAALASSRSEDPGSKARGGDLGLFGRGQMVGEFEQAAFSASPGDLVGPVRTNFGYHLIQVLEKRAAGLQPFEEVRERILGQLLCTRTASLAESKARELAGRMERAGLDTSEELRSLADSEVGVTFHTTPPFSREDNVPGIGRATAFSVAAFELASGEVSEAVRVAKGWAVLELREAREPRLPELTEVRQEVEQALHQIRQLELARQRLEEGRTVAAESGLEALGVELGLEVEGSPEFGRRGPVGRLGAQHQLAAEALRLDVGELGGPVVLDRSAVLFEVAERTRFDPVQFEQDKAETRDTLLEERLAQMLAALVARRRDELEVRYDTQLLRNFDLLLEDQS